MKKVFLAISIVTLFLVSCGNNTSTESTTTNDSCATQAQDSACCDKADTPAVVAPVQDSVQH
jgi:uncharacterized lipoprotein NlpE involved in copper resistance